ncbi:MAG TPA: hypothetical protein DD727_07890 [Clostridiales bacterium]|nr:hypothetical protein [Clostridiales bacterium]
MSGKEKKWIISLIMLLLGMLIALQARATLAALKTRANPDHENFLMEYTSRLQEEKEIGLRLKAQVDELESQKNTEIKQMTFYNQDLDYMNELDRLKLMAGLTSVKGPGLSVIINDATQSSRVNPNDSIVHYRDLLAVLNVLKTAGAQALSVNGQRIIAASEVVCTGPTVRINKYRYSVPYEIKAVGDIDLMYSSLAESEIVADLRDYSIQIQISKVKEVLIPGYSNDISRLISGLSYYDPGQDGAVPEEEAAGEEAEEGAAEEGESEEATGENEG